jgi:hypothetical protein
LAEELMDTTHSEADFDRLSWHDCHIWGLSFSVGDPAEEDCTSDLVFDIDFILEWLRPSADKYQFRVAPAQLVFHGVTDLRISIDWGDSGFQVAVHGVSIAAVSRELVPDQKAHLDRPYYKWRILLNWPEGEIVFGATGFTQTLLADPVLTDNQHLSPVERSYRR